MDLEKVDFLTEIDSLRRGWQACEARLATVEAERDAAQKRVQDCETRMMRYAIELAEMRAERDAARAEAEKLRDKAELLDEIITNRISLSYRDGIPVTAHIWSARTDNGFGTGNTLPEALAALRAAKAGGK